MPVLLHEAYMANFPPVLLHISDTDHIPKQTVRL